MRRSHFNLIAVFALAGKLIAAQEVKDSIRGSALKSFAKATLGISPGLEWEQWISGSSVINVFEGINIGTASDDFMHYSSDWGIVPDNYIEYRRFYNFFKRVKKNKRTDFNSADFFFGRVEVYYPVKDQNFFNLLFIEGWGGQRCFWRRINGGTHIGLVQHFYYDRPPKGGFNYIKIEPFIDFTLSYIF